MGHVIGIDAMRTRSGGGISHLIGILNELDPVEFGIEHIHVWTDHAIAPRLPEKSWLTIHTPSVKRKNLLSQMLWQFLFLKGIAQKLGIEVMLRTDGGSVNRFQPSVLMCRDMLSFETRETDRYEVGRDWFRLIALRHLKIITFKKANAVLFLTDYAKNKVFEWTGELPVTRVIPHGISPAFKLSSAVKPWPDVDKEPVRVIYVSNIARYKHQWNVIEAINQLVTQGYRVHLTLVGGGKGPGMKRVQAALEKFEKSGEFISMYPFLPHAEIVEKIADSHVFLFASSCENMPNTLLEGMACGIPIACSSLGPMPEVLQDGGAFFNPEDSNSIAAALVELFENPTLREYSRIKARQLANQYSWKRCASETMQYLIDVKYQFLKNISLLFLCEFSFAESSWYQALMTN